ncbi:MAG: RNA polymerase sigma factor [Bacteroidia bacterium]
MTRHRSLIIIRTLNYLKDEQETEDFIGTLFLKLRDSLQKDHHIKEPKAWLRRLITNTLIDQTRRQNLHQAFIQTPTELSEDHQNKSMLKLDSGMLSEAIESLHALPKMYIIKHFFQGKQNKEIADEMGLNMNQVRGARDRALKALKTTLSPVFFEYFNE